jgi:hypothetical protein
LFGDDFFRQIARAGVGADAGMEYLERLPQLRGLFLAMPDVTDAGLSRLAGALQAPPTVPKTAILPKRS